MSIRILLGDESAAALLRGAEAWRGEAFDDRALIAKRVAALMADLGLKGKPLEAAVLDAFGVRDPEAEAIRDAKGNVEPDAGFDGRW